MGPVNLWSTWRNKADRDLLGLSEERGASVAYCIVARHLGIVQESKREVYEERESVWVFEPGEVQPRRATVLEDTPAAADTVLLEFWEGEIMTAKVDRALIMKSAA